METVGIVIPVFGDDPIWDDLAKRAWHSATTQTRAPTDVLVSRGETLSDARNHGARVMETDWLIFLDASDELDRFYVEAMLEHGYGDVRQPSTLGVVNGIEDDHPVLIKPQSSLMVGNHLIIGSMVRKSYFDIVGGFRDLPILEDWDLWIRIWWQGAEIGQSPLAIYRVHVIEGSRNTNLELHGQVYREIQQRYAHLAGRR